MKDFIVLYNTAISSQNSQSLDYYIIRFLNLPIGKNSALSTIYSDMFVGRECSTSTPIGPFYDIAELDRYCFKITQDFNLKRIGLLELERYNRMVDETHNLTELKILLSKKCDYIENPDYRKRGILKSLLN